MRFMNHQSNTLKNIVLFLCSLVFVFCIAEYALRKINIEGLYGERILVERSPRGLAKYQNMAKVLTAACPEFDFVASHCYPSDPARRLPLKVINPDDGKYWYCVPYNVMQRYQGYSPERKKQFVLVGDSFTFGQGLKETDTLGYMLNEAYRDINFQNRGQSGADTDSVAKICKDIIESAPKADEVIYFYNLNDVRKSDTINTRMKQGIINFQYTKWANDKVPGETVVVLLSKSALFSLARKVWVIRRDSYLEVQNYKDMYLSESNRREFLSTMDEIRSIKDMLAERGISFRMIIYPLLHKDLMGRYPFEGVHEAIINACNERGVECLDGYAPFKKYYSLKKFAVHPLDYHPNGLSNRELVDYIRKKDFITGRTK
jgi:hypothetical protein